MLLNADQPSSTIVLADVEGTLGVPCTVPRTGSSTKYESCALPDKEYGGRDGAKADFLRHMERVFPDSFPNPYLGTTLPDSNDALEMCTEHMMKESVTAPSNPYNCNELEHPFPHQRSGLHSGAATLFIVKCCFSPSNFAGATCHEPLNTSTSSEMRLDVKGALHSTRVEVAARLGRG